MVIGQLGLLLTHRTGFKTKLSSNSLSVAYLTHQETRNSFLRSDNMSQLKKASSAGLILGFTRMFDTLVVYFDPSLAYVMTCLFIVSICAVQN
jgi:hypothetical protein